MSETLSRVEFIASLAARGNAIQFGSDGSSLRLDVPGSDDDALLLVQKYFRNRTFKVTFEPDDSERERDERKRDDEWSYPQAKCLA